MENRDEDHSDKDEKYGAGVTERIESQPTAAAGLDETQVHNPLLLTIAALY
jgi:hypothetical protein